MSSANYRLSQKSSLSAWLVKMGIAFVVLIEIAPGATHSNSFAASQSVRKPERFFSSGADDQTFSPTAKISASVGKGGKNEKQDVLLVKRLLSKFGYKLTLN